MRHLPPHFSARLPLQVVLHSDAGAAVHLAGIEGPQKQPLISVPAMAKPCWWQAVAHASCVREPGTCGMCGRHRADTFALQTVSTKQPSCLVTLHAGGGAGAVITGGKGASNSNRGNIACSRPVFCFSRADLQ